MRYTELLDDWSFEQNWSSSAGVRAFIEQSDGPITTLPAIGDSYTDFRAAKVDSIKSVYFWFEGAAGAKEKRKKIVVQYRTPNFSSSSSDQDSGNDPEGRRFQLGAEVISIDYPEDYTWYDGSTAVDQPIWKSVPTGSFTIPLRISAGANKTVFIETCIAQAGTVNNDVFEDWRAGSILFDGIDGGSGYDEDGDLYWQFNANFTWRIVRGDFGGQPIVGDDWQFVFRKDTIVGTPVWDIPLDVDGKLPFEQSDLSAIVALGESGGSAAE